MENIELGEELRHIDIGGGDFVNVYFGTYLKEENLKNQKILIAKVPPNALDRNAIELLKLANHRNILNFLNVFNRDNNFFITSSYQEFNLHSLIYEKNHVFEPRQTAEFVLQIIEGINWFHNFLLFHSYINPKDIYLQNYSTIKISGFYFSEIFESDVAVTSRPNRPLPYRCPPEEINNLGLKYDIWCIGLVLYELCFRNSPENELATKLNSDWNKNLERLPNEFNKYFKFLFKLLLEYNFKSRKSTTELRNDPSIQSLIALRESSLSKIGRQMGQYVVHKWIEKSTYKVFDNKAGEYRILKLRSTLDDSVSDVYREIEILTQCKNDSFPYVITYFDHFVYNIDYVCIVTEYSEFGSLNDQLNEYKINRVRFDPIEIYELIRQLISGIKFIHGSLGIIHRLIKPSNIIMFRTNEGKRALKYCDFYFARKLLDIDFSAPKYITTAPGVSDYTAPEMVFKDKYDWLVDVWSLGCIIYEMNTLTKPFDISKFNMFNRVVQSGQDHVPELPNGNLYKLLVKMMLQIDPEKRASAQKCYDHLRALNPRS